MVLENLGDHIRTVRKARGLSQEALARRADVSLNLVGKLELGMITNPHYTTLAGIARALDVRVEELVEPEASTTGKASAPPETGLAGADPSGRLAPAKVLEDIAELWAEQLARGFYDRRTLGQMRMTGFSLAATHEAAAREHRQSLPPHFLEQLEAAEERFVAVGTQIWEAIEEADRGQAAPPDELAARREAKSEELRQQLRGSPTPAAGGASR